MTTKITHQMLDQREARLLSKLEHAKGSSHYPVVLLELSAKFREIDELRSILLASTKIR